MKKALLPLAAILILSGCITAPTEIETACVDSGGTFTNETCECPDDSYGEENWPLYEYDEETENCIDAFGIPGGTLGEKVQADHAANMTE